MIPRGQRPAVPTGWDLSGRKPHYSGSLQNVKSLGLVQASLQRAAPSLTCSADAQVDWQAPLSQPFTPPPASGQGDPSSAETSRFLASLPARGHSLPGDLRELVQRIGGRKEGWRARPWREQVKSWADARAWAEVSHPRGMSLQDVCSLLNTPLKSLLGNS